VVSRYACAAISAASGVSCTKSPGSGCMIFLLQQLWIVYLTHAEMVYGLLKPCSVVFIGLTNYLVQR
jgi:hypothetical protein